MITYRFIENARYHMGSLGFKPKKLEELDLDNLKQQTIDKIFRLKYSNEAFYLYTHYEWLVKHWKKLLKAVSDEKWQLCDYPYTPLDVSLSRQKYDNVSFVTNMFGKELQLFYLDENSNVNTFTYNKKGNKDKSNDFQFIDDKQSDEGYIFTKKYLNSLKKDQDADPEKAIATVEKRCLNYKKAKFLFYITYLTENISKEKISTITAQNMAKEIGKVIQYHDLINLNSLLMIRNLGGF